MLKERKGSGKEIEETLGNILRNICEWKISTNTLRRLSWSRRVFSPDLCTAQSFLPALEKKIKAGWRQKRVGSRVLNQTIVMQSKLMELSLSGGMKN
jgi:hypothetical protein